MTSRTRSRNENKNAVVGNSEHSAAASSPALARKRPRSNVHDDQVASDVGKRIFKESNKGPSNSPVEDENLQNVPSALDVKSNEPAVATKISHVETMIPTLDTASDVTTTASADLSSSGPGEEKMAQSNKLGEASSTNKCKVGVEPSPLAAVPEGWASKLNAGDLIDTMCPYSGKWMIAKVISLDEDQIQIHYMGWKNRHDAWVDRHGDLIMPLHFQTKESDNRWNRQAKSKAAEVMTESAAGSGTGLAVVPDAADEPLSDTLHDIGVTRSGRIVKSRSSIAAQTPASASTVKGMAGSPTMAVASDKVLEDDNDLWCSTCLKIEDEFGSQMLCCDGPCKRSFHVKCLCMDKVPDADTWECDECSANNHSCWGCNRRGTVGKGKNALYKCIFHRCGKFFHLNCVWQNSFTRARKGDLQGGVRFLCPHHTCHTCGGKASAAGGVMKCMLCPSSFHPKCTPPSARFNEAVLLCGSHKDIDLPSDSSGEILTMDVSDKLVFKMPKLNFPRAPPSANSPEDPLHFRILRSIVETVRKEPPQFSKIRRSIYLCKPVRVKQKDMMCNCKDYCGEDCLNRAMMIECFGERESKSGTNCAIGVGCRNRALQSRATPKIRHRYFGGKGWGVTAEEHIESGRLVIEYVGEVIDEAEQERRLSEHRRKHPHDNNMYIMELGPNQYIDAREKGNISRLINHSCDPCCQLQKWNVNGYTRIGIFATRDIERGTELSYDYQFFTQEASKFKCLCNTSKCRGTLAPKMPGGNGLEHGEQNKVKVKLTKKEKADLLKAKKKAEQRGLKAQARQGVAKLRRMSLTSSKVPGDEYYPIRSGLPAQDIYAARERKVFLIRNARLGEQMLQRLRLRIRRRSPM